MPTNLLRFAADVAIEASADSGKIPRFSGTAYSGGLMQPGGWGSLVIDLAGADVSGAIPVLGGHDETLDGICGQGRAEIRDGKILVSGHLTDATVAGAKVIALARAGINLQASIGLMPSKREHVRAGESVIVNLRKFTAPENGLTIVRAGKLREVSLLPIGADSETSIAITAKGKSKMEHHQQFDEEQVNAEMRAALPENQAGMSDPQKVLARWSREKSWHYADGPRERAEAAMIQAASGKITYSDFERVLLESRLADSELAQIRNERPPMPGIHGSTRDVPGGDPVTIRAAGLMLRAGFSKAAERAFGEPILHAAEKMGRLHLLDLARSCVQSEGREAPSDREALVKAGFSTVSMPAALGLAGEKVLLDAYAQAPAAWRQWCKTVSVASFRDHTILRPSFLGGFERLPAGGEIKHAHVGEETAVVTAATYAKLLSIDRQQLVNDDSGAFAQAAAAMGRAAARKLADLTIETLLAGIEVFFTEARGNLIDDPLSMAAVATALALVRAQVDLDGGNLDIVPMSLVVGPALESTARAICESEFIRAEEGAPSGNSLRGVLSVVVEPRLTNKACHANASSTCWAVLAGPVDAVQAVCFLNGAENPTVEELGLQADVNHLGFSWRAFLDFGSTLVDWRAGVVSTGDA